MKLGIFVKTHRFDFSDPLMRLLDWLKARGCEAVVEESVVSDYSLCGIESVEKNQIPARVDVVVVFGGDGTLLSVARLMQENDCPILGVNLGSLGFLTEVTLDELYPVLGRVIEGDFRIEKRRMLKAELRRTQGTIESFHALNDAVINKAALARVISVDAFIRDDFIANFVADGMIVSTPTGSTAYSLSAGGPILFPSIEALVITPICPHTLTNRALVVPDSDPVRLVLRSGEDVMLTLDGQVGVPVQDQDEIVCARSPFEISLIRPNARGFFDVLREKLKWAQR